MRFSLTRIITHYSQPCHTCFHGNVNWVKRKKKTIRIWKQCNCNWCQTLFQKSLLKSPSRCALSHTDAFIGDLSTDSYLIHLFERWSIDWFLQDGNGNQTEDRKPSEVHQVDYKQLNGRILIWVWFRELISGSLVWSSIHGNLGDNTRVWTSCLTLL